MTQKTYITSDNHFSHKNISNFCPQTRPHKDWQVMDQKMILQWQTQVQPNDIVYLLGDVFFCNAAEAIKIMERLPGQKHLIYGNHDKIIRSNSVLRHMFVAVHEYKEIVIDKQQLVLFHYPMWEWNRMNRGAIHFYGHIHFETSNVGGRTVNVCVDSPEMNDGDVPYALYPIEDAIAYGLKSEIRRHHDRVTM